MVVVVDEVLEQLFGEVVEIVEGCALDEVLIERAPKAFDLAIGLRLAFGVALLNARN
nr:hypothetical protein [Bradyrhizobium archetypum]